MAEITYALNVILPLPEGPITLIAEVMPLDDPAEFLVKQVSFQKETATIPFMTEFHLIKKEVDNTVQWFHKERARQTLLGQAVGQAIDEVLTTQK